MIMAGGDNEQDEIWDLGPKTRKSGKSRVIESRMRAKFPETGSE